MFHKVTFRTSPRYKISMIVLKEVPSDDNKVNKRQLPLMKYYTDIKINAMFKYFFYLHPVNISSLLLIINCTTFNSDSKDLQLSNYQNYQKQLSNYYLQRLQLILNDYLL